LRFASYDEHHLAYVSRVRRSWKSGRKREWKSEY
jgi:hypothetical protein